MSLHSELLKQARFLAQKEPKKPTQASLRRSVSASYYALFHLLVDEATKLMLSGHARGPLRDCLSRAFHHAAMKQIAVQFTNNAVSPKLASGFNQQPTRREALDLADLTDQAFRDWARVRGSLQADTFLTGLLAYRHMQG